MEWNTNKSLCGYDQDWKTSRLWIFYTLPHYHDYCLCLFPYLSPGIYLLFLV